MLTVFFKSVVSIVVLFRYHLVAPVEFTGVR